MDMIEAIASIGSGFPVLVQDLASFCGYYC